MKIALIADAFPPLRSSAAVQLRDLSLEFLRQGHEVVVITPSSDINRTYSSEKLAGIDILRIKSPKTKDVNYFKRTVAELLMPFILLRGLRSANLSRTRWDGVVWYSPTIFNGPLVSYLRKHSSCRSYLILRDIFPEWAVEMGLMGQGLPYRMFKAVANYQYSVADVIGVQTPGNLSYFTDWLKGPRRRVEVLQNWLSNAPAAGCSISIDQTTLAGRNIFVYAGNMGVAQGMGILLKLAERLKQRSDIGFLFVGRGSDAQRLRAEAKQRVLENVAFFDEIDPDEIPGLYAQCHVGLVALDPRHKTHNIPGKFLSYMQAGLPVLASINPGNDLVDLITTEQVGRVVTDTSAETMTTNALELLESLGTDAGFKDRCERLASRLFSPEVAVKKIVNALQA
jgi:glycosyltransferase involved in cell wall biosynthesis